MHIRTLSSLSPAEVDDLAKAAADRLEPHYSANPYLAGTVNHIRFATSYAARNVELQLELAPT
ncbi:MAG: hypothetical protein I8H71_01305 [Xanthomonadaceae bacterium]|nr:hypothetical protein [Xanthomonadaceae bacterium]